MRSTNGWKITVLVGAMAAIPLRAQVVAYDNTSNFQTVSTRGNIEIGDEINLTTGATTITEFSFEYSFTGTSPATGLLRVWDKTGSGGLIPGNMLYQSAPFPLQSGFHSVSETGLSVPVPGTLVWTVDFDGVTGSDNAGLLFYNGVGVGGGPGQSFDNHWENLGTVLAPNWTLANNSGVIDNFGARVTVVPESNFTAFLVACGLVAFAALRVKREVSHD